MKEFKKFLKYFREIIWRDNRFYFSIFLLLTLFSVQSATITSLFVKQIVDKGIIKGQFKVIVSRGSFALLLWLASIALSFLSTLMLRLLKNKAETKLKTRILEKFFNLRYDYVSSYPSAYFLSRIYIEPGSIISSLLNITSGMILNLSWILLGFSIGFLIAPQLCVFILPFFIFSILLNYKFGAKFKFFTKERNERNAVLRGYVNNLIENYKLIRIYNCVEYIKEAFKKRLQDFLKFLTKITIFSSGFNNLQSFIQMSMQISLLIFAGSEIVKNKLTIGSYLGFSAILWQLLSAIEGFYNSIISVRESVGEIERMEEIEKAEVKYDLRYKIQRKDKLVLKNVKVILNHNKEIDYPDMEINKGEKVLIVGDNGAGKTTLLYLIAGFYPFKGEFFSPFKNISMSFASPLLIQGDVYQNLKIVPQFDENEAEHLLKFFGLEKYKRKEANSLSAGEKKKVDIIRCLLKNSDLYLFDEPFANLDEDGKEKFLKILREKDGKTIIVTSPVEIYSSEKIFDKIIKLNKIKKEVR